MNNWYSLYFCYTHSELHGSHLLSFEIEHQWRHSLWTRVDKVQGPPTF